MLIGLIFATYDYIGIIPKFFKDICLYVIILFNFANYI